MPEIKFGPCCFCGNDIGDQPPDPCSVRVATVDGKWQVWRCHAACFRERLAVLPEAPGLFEPAYF
jgi:hypothetical protein